MDRFTCPRDRSGRERQRKRTKGWKTFPTVEESEADTCDHNGCVFFLSQSLIPSLLPDSLKLTVDTNLRALAAIWAVYNTVRYFLAFSIYTRDASMGQEFCFALGTSSGLSCAFSLCALGLSIVKRKLLLRGLPFKHLDYICSSLHYLSSICLLGPAAANFAILFVWKNSTHPRYDLNRRCHVDIDVIWSASTHLCNDNAPSTAVWITLSSLRLAVTLIIIVSLN